MAFWKDDKKNEHKRLTEEAVALAVLKFTNGRLFGSDLNGWGDAELPQDRGLYFRPHAFDPALILSGCAFRLSDAQAERLTCAIHRRILNNAKKD